MQGHIHKRTRTSRNGKAATLWYVVIDIGRRENGSRRQKWHGGYRTRRDAEAARARLVTEVNDGSYAPPSRTTFADWVENGWLPTIKTQIKPSTYDSYRRMMKLHVVPTLGHRALQHFTAPMLTRLYADLLEGGKRDGSGGLSAKTVRYVHTTIHKALADAVDAGVLTINVADRAKAPRPSRIAAREMQFWAPGELREFLHSVHGLRLEAAWHLAAMTGMRRGEVLGLRWRDVDLDACRLAIRQTIISIAYEVAVSTPKTHQARTVDLDAATVGQLRAHGERQRLERATWGVGYGENDLVFRRENGEPIHPDTFTQSFERAIAKTALPKIRLHDLRHTHATIALRAGVPVKVISERLGHESPAFTLKQYAHVLPGMQAEAAADIARLVLEDPDA